VSSKGYNIRFGDVMISKPTGTFGNIIQYDFGKTIQDDKFIRTGSLNKFLEILLTALSNLKAKHMIESHEIIKYFSKIIEKYSKMVFQFTCPGIQYNLLYEMEYDYLKEYTIYL
jgi:hypothetical protein